MCAVFAVNSGYFCSHEVCVGMSSTAVGCLLSVPRKKTCIRTEDSVGAGGVWLTYFYHLFQTLELLFQTNSFSCLFDFWFFNIL